MGAVWFELARDGGRRRPSVAARSRSCAEPGRARRPSPHRAKPSCLTWRRFAGEPRRSMADTEPVGIASEHAEWPAHFPKCCPPATAEDLGGIVYMLVGHDPPTPEDMECAIDRRSHKGKDECRST